MRCLCTIAALLLPSLLAAQTPAQAPSEQTARQALIEMFFGQTPNHLEKHLPDVTRKTFQRMDSGNGQSFLSEFSMLATQAKSAGAALQTFDTGPILLSAADPRGEAEKVEITVERDDLVGEEDQIELALHITQNAKEEALPFVPRFTFSMKMESDVWRLNEISVSVRLPLADPDFLKSIEGKQRTQNEQMTIWALRSVNMGEKSYSSAQGSFACTLSALAGSGKAGERAFLYDSQLAGGKKNGYIYVISGCDASHYKVVAEPAVPDSGQRAFCSDESGAIRASADGKATTCLSGGEPVEEKSTSVILTAPAAESSSAAVSEQAALKAKSPVAERVRVSQGVTQGLIINKVNPVYPDVARTSRVQGQVVLRGVIGKDGSVENLQVISGHPMLTQAALDAVKQWKYRPYILQGRPVEVETQVTVIFQLVGTQQPDPTLNQ